MKPEMWLFFSSLLINNLGLTLTKSKCASFKTMSENAEHNGKWQKFLLHKVIVASTNKCYRTKMLNIRDGGVVNEQIFYNITYLIIRNLIKLPKCNLSFLSKKTKVILKFYLNTYRVVFLPQKMLSDSAFWICQFPHRISTFR